MEEKVTKLEINKKEKIKNWFKWFFFSFIWLGLLMLALDLISKQCIVAFQDNIPLGGVKIIPNFITVDYVVNTNFIFGIPLSSPAVNRIIYIIIGTILSGGLITYYVIKQKKMTKWVKAIMMVIIAGALGNLIDRIFYNADFLRFIKDGQYVENGVVDWIRFEFNWFPYTFNWADSCLVVGVIMLIIWMIVTSIIDYKKEHANDPKVKVEKQLSSDEIKKLEKEKRDSIKENSEEKK